MGFGVNLNYLNSFTFSCVIMGKFVDFLEHRFLQRIVVRIRRMTSNVSITVPGTHDWSSMNGKYDYGG